MRKKDSWTSEFRKKKYYENQYQRKEKQFYKNGNVAETNPFTTLKTISILLDLEGTCDFLDDQKASIFINQLEYLRKKFNANIGTISISTHYNRSDKIEEVLNILNRNLTKNIQIGSSFYYGGIYEYDQKTNIPMSSTFNLDKIKTFKRYYLDCIKYDNQWFAIIDDGVEADIYKEYQDNHPMVLCRPSKQEYDLLNNCFMSISTVTKGFDGVIETLDTYIKSIQHESSKKILELQRDMISHLPSYELSNKIRMREYRFIERYFKEGYADDSDYKDTVFWLMYTNSNQEVTKEELIIIKEIVSIITEKFQESNNVKQLEKVKQFKRMLKI